MERASHMVWGVGIVCALVLVNAFFIAAEYALMRVRRTRMEALAAQGSGLAKQVAMLPTPTTASGESAAEG
jgi:CBS domain containing-hemolysin-like protein